MVLEGAELCVEHMVKWKWSEEISAAGLAGKHWTPESVPGLGASSLRWGTTKLYHSHLVRARHVINAFCARQEENTVAVTAGGHVSRSTSREAVSGVFLVCRDHREGSQEWIRPAFGCTEPVKQSKTQGKSFFRSPAEFALTLPHLVWGKQESGYYEHFLFIKLELQELICLLGTFAEYKAVSCPARTTCLCGRSPSVSGTGSTSSTLGVAKALPWLVSKARSRFFWPGVRAFLWKSAFASLSSPSPEFCWRWGGLQQSIVCFIAEVLLRFSKGKSWDDPPWGSEEPCRATFARACTYHGAQTPAAKTTFTGEADSRQIQLCKPRWQ